MSTRQLSTNTHFSLDMSKSEMVNLLKSYGIDTKGLKTKHMAKLISSTHQQYVTDGTHTCNGSFLRNPV